MTIRFLVLSDTHDNAFPSPNQMPKADVILHCGDLTMIGGLSNYRKAIEQLAECDAEFKLVIPGNHDVSLDPKWWADNLEDDDDLEEPQKALCLFEAATSRGLRLLSEGLHRFQLRDGRSFSIYASPYTPQFNGYAFAYDPKEPKFSERSIGSNDVDIVMTHGPPQIPVGSYRLDLAGGTHCGCPALWKAIKSAKPRLHCFGHIHEGHGAQLATWNSSTMATTGSGVMHLEELDGRTLSAPDAGQTLFLNASIMMHGKGENNCPWIVDLEERKIIS